MPTKNILTSAAAVLVGVLAPSGANQQPDACSVEYANDALSVDCDSVELARALDGIERETGVVFHLDAGLGDKISVRVREATLAGGIEAVLAGYSYVSIYGRAADGERRLSSVRVLPSDSAPDPPAYEPVAPGRQGERGDFVEEGRDGVSIARDASGHFVAAGAINGVPVEFLIDTGATIVALPQALASDMGLVYGREMTIQTANGQTSGSLTMLARVELGGLAVENVPGIILPNMGPGRRVLLGMSFLGGFELMQTGDGLTIRLPGRSDPLSPTP